MSTSSISLPIHNKTRQENVPQQSVGTKKVYIRTFGCQMNVYDTGKMRALLEKDGYVTTESMEEADLVIVNTCSIREKPELKVHSFLGEAR